MLTVTVLSAAFLLTAPACGKQHSRTDAGPSLWNNLGERTPSVQLDPELRRALLRALTQLENEAEHQNAREPLTYNRTEDQPDDIQENLKHDLKQLIANFQIGDAYENDQKIDAEDAGEFKRTLEVEDGYKDEVSEKYKGDYGDSKSQNQENFQQVTDSIIGREAKQLEFSTASEETSELGTPGPEDEPTQAAIFYQNSEPVDRVKTTELPQEVKISHPSNDIIASPAEIQDTREVSPRQKTTPSDAQAITPTASSGVTKSGADEAVVSIFQAPLVYAFTLHHDESGLPTSVIPLLPPQPTAPTLPAHQSQDQQLLLLRERELLHRTRLLEQQLEQYRQQQRLQQQLFLQQQQQNGQAFFSPQHQFPTTGGSTSRRPQRQETGTGIVDFQPSVEFPVNRDTHSAPLPQRVDGESYRPSSDYVAVSPSQQENGLVPPPLPLPQPPSFIRPQAPPSAFSHLQNLLYQAGVPDTPQQDLSIVSKVLSLNHLRRQDDAHQLPSQSS